MKKITNREINEQRHFDIYAKEYDINYSYTNSFTKYKIKKKFLDLTKEIASLVMGKNVKILDIGCGTGEYTKLIAQKYPHAKVIGLDISSGIIEVAKEKCKKFKNTKFVVKSAYKTGYPSNSFQIVTGFYILHHLDLDNVIKEVYRILQPGGVCFFYEPNILNPVVYLIKSNKYIKSKIGDSPDEWAINPLTIRSNFRVFDNLKVNTSEFIWPVLFFPTSWLIRLDKITSILRFIPPFKYFGGSVEIIGKK